MTNDQWRKFFNAGARVLGPGTRQAAHSVSWCAWTTFGRLSTDIFYWTAGLPAPNDLGDVGINDAGVWGQPFLYRDLAHIVIPREFFWETIAPASYTNGIKQQDIGRLAKELTEGQIAHRITDLVLEIKLY